jgi:hypothetical protein
LAGAFALVGLGRVLVNLVKPKLALSGDAGRRLGEGRGGGHARGGPRHAQGVPDAPAGPPRQLPRGALPPGRPTCRSGRMAPTTSTPRSPASPASPTSPSSAWTASRPTSPRRSTASSACPSAGGSRCTRTRSWPSARCATSSGRCAPRRPGRWCCTRTAAPCT